jgi:hypothetical protein
MKTVSKSIIDQAARKLAETWAAEPADPFKVEAMSTDKGRRGVVWREVRPGETFEVLRDARGWWTRSTMQSGAVRRNRIEAKTAKLLVGAALLGFAVGHPVRGSFDLGAVGRLLIGGAR